MTRRILLIMLALSLFALPVFAGGAQEEPATEPAATAEKPVSLEKTTMDPRLYTPGKLTVATGEPAYPPWMMDDD
ncbi:MAG TPA: amino acid ABC transporter substrate-binding protein, partial [Spirochaeta sp.]|nr:amino acid ABC transporter substrate-binding protein [Spirochaeta sp.]